MDRQGRIVVLLVGSDRPELQVLADLVRKAGYEVSSAERRADAVAALETGRPDVALVEAVAPVDDGHAIIRELRALSSLPIVALTALGDGESKRRARDAGADDALTVPASAVDVELRMAVAVRLASLVRERDRALAVLAERDHADDATGLYNRTGFRDHLDREYARARRHGHPLALLVLDIDRLGAINKRRGRDAGDRALSRVAETVRQAVREADIAARTGDDELAIVAPDTSGDDGLHLAERLRALIARQCGDGGGKITTVSIGVASMPGLRATSAQQLVEAAEAALERAKKRGRNRCELAAD